MPGFNGDGSGTSTLLYYPSGVATDLAGKVYIADSVNSRVRLWTASTRLTTTIAGNGIQGFAGDGGAGTSALLNTPVAVAVDSVGDVYIADVANQRVLMWTASTRIIITIVGNGVSGFSGDGGAGTSAQLSLPSGVAVDGAGHVFVADSLNNRIRMWTASTRIVTTVVGTSAALSFPQDVAVDVAGNVYIADYYNNRIPMWNASTGVVTTIVGTGVRGFSGDGGAGTSASLSYPMGVAVDAFGFVYIADKSQHVRMWMASSNIITTIAGSGGGGFGGDGGAATSAELNMNWEWGCCGSAPNGVAVDAVGNVFIADVSNHRVRALGAIVISSTCTPMPTPSSSPTPFCWPSLYRALPRMDIVGTLVGSALFPGADFLAASENGCRQACCDAPACDAYTFSAVYQGISATGTAPCFLYVNVTALVPNSGFNSGALLSVYS